MKVFDIITHSTYSQTHSVVAESMAIAEKLFLEKYPFTEILEIKLHSNYVQVQKNAPEEFNEAQKQPTTTQCQNGTAGKPQVAECSTSAVA